MSTPTASEPAVVRKGGNSAYLLYMICFVLTVNSATQGYDSSMMNGLQMLPSYVDYFELTTATIALNVAIVFVGAILGMPFAGPVADRWGRKWGMASASILCMVGAAIQSAAIHEAMFCIGRMMVGFALTIGGSAAPVYISEVAPPKHRVTLTGLFGTSWYVGSLIAAGVTYGSQYIESTWSWRLPSLLQFLPSICCLIPLPFVPESPRWLIYQGRNEEARAILTKYHGDGDENSAIVAIEYEEICQTLEFEKTVQNASFRTLFNTKANRWRSGIVAAVAVFCQVSGNNIITYYLGSVLTAAGVTGVQTQLGISLGLSGWNLLCATAGSWATERVGRRQGFREYLHISRLIPFCLGAVWSTGTMSILLIVMSALTKVYGTSPPLSTSSAQVALIYLFYGAYSFVWTPLATVYTVEVLSYSIRANGLAYFNGICFGAGFINTFVIPYAMEWSAWTFYLITALWCLFLEVPIMYFYFPATERRGLEEIDIIFEGTSHVNLDVKSPSAVHDRAVDIEKKGVERLE